MRGNCREHGYRLGYAPAAAAGADKAASFEISHMQNLGELPVAILAEKDVLRHGCFLLAPRRKPAGRNARLRFLPDILKHLGTIISAPAIVEDR
jgi:hypothetical protein